MVPLSVVWSIIFKWSTPDAPITPVTPRLGVDWVFPVHRTHFLFGSASIRWLWTPNKQWCGSGSDRGGPLGLGVEVKVLRGDTYFWSLPWVTSFSLKSRYFVRSKVYSGCKKEGEPNIIPIPYTKQCFLLIKLSKSKELDKTSIQGPPLRR